MRKRESEGNIGSNKKQQNYRNNKETWKETWKYTWTWEEIKRIGNIHKKNSIKNSSNTGANGKYNLENGKIETEMEYV